MFMTHFIFNITIKLIIICYFSKSSCLTFYSKGHPSITHLALTVKYGILHLRELFFGHCYKKPKAAIFVVFLKNIRKNNGVVATETQFSIVRLDNW